MIVKIKTSKLNTNIDRAEEQLRGSKIKQKSSYKHNANGQRNDTYEIKVQGHGGCIQKLQIHIIGSPERENEELRTRNK